MSAEGSTSIGRLLAAVLVGLGVLPNASEALAESAVSPSPVPSQRLIAPQHEVAITVPASWDLKALDPDGEPPSSSSHLSPRELVFASQPLQEGGSVLCAIHVYATEDGAPVALDEEVGGRILDLQTVPELELLTPAPEPVELPAGLALRVGFDQVSPTPSLPDGRARVVEYFLARADELYLVGCRRAPGDVDSWLTIAETLEFLPAEEE